uniref:Transmembrane protein 110, like n=1 Tax=Hucho hucho TaxID=62062 RepID=A0A4W5KBP6_9TELE
MGREEQWVPVRHVALSYQCPDGDGWTEGDFSLFYGCLSLTASLHLSTVKRFRAPIGIRRPWRICHHGDDHTTFHPISTGFMSKQAIGALFIHFANVFLSNLTELDPCSLYLINFLLDATLGMLVIWAGVKVVSRIVKYKQFALLTFGEYGDPPQAAAWLGQCGSVVSLVLLIPGWTNVSSLCCWTTSLVLVMLIVPVIVNSIMFWVVDSLMMRKYKTLKSLDDTCDPLTKVDSTAPWVTGDESQVRVRIVIFNGCEENITLRSSLVNVH